MECHGIELTNFGLYVSPFIPEVEGNKIGFNDLRGTALQIALTPDGLDEDNKISRNLGDNRGHGLHPSAFGPGGN